MIMHLGPAGRGIGAITGVDGRFSAIGLQAGSHYVQATHPNFPGPFGLPQGGSYIDVQSGRQAGEVVIKLLPAGVVSGKVLDDGGEPVSDCTISLFTARIGNSLSHAGVSGFTDDQGDFRLEPIAPDRYVLFAKCAEDLPAEQILDSNHLRGFETTQTWQSLFYPNSPTFGGATEIGVAAGAEVQLELHLKPQGVRTLRGVLTGLVGNVPKRAAQVYLARTGTGSDPTRYESESVNQEDNSFRFGSVEPGAYLLSVLSWDAASEVRYWAQAPVTVGDAEPPRVVLPLQPLSLLTGKVESRRSEEAPSTPGTPSPGAASGPASAGDEQFPGIVILTPSPRADQVSDQHAIVNRKDGSFRFLGVTPGRWKVQYHSRRQPAWIESVQYGESAQENGEIEVTPGAVPPLHLRLSSEFARPRLELKIPSNAARSYWVVYAVPVKRQRLDAPVVAAVGYPESLTAVTSLPPDQYSFFAVPRTAGGGTFNERFAELMSRQVAPVEIFAKRETTVEVRCFLPEEVERIIAAYMNGDAR